MKVKVWIAIESSGDGSASARFFNSKADAEAYMSNDEFCDERFCDDIYSKELEFDDKGVLLNPNKRDEDE